MVTLQKHCDKKYLLLPIAAGEPLDEICIYADGKKIYDFKVSSAGQHKYCDLKAVEVLKNIVFSMFFMLIM